MTDPYLNSLDLNDFTAEFRLVAEIIGIDNARKLLQSFPGMWIYVPTAKRMQQAARRYIAERYRAPSDGEHYDNARDIAAEMGMSVTFVRRCARELPENRGGPS